MDSINFTQVTIAFGVLLLLLGLFWYGARALSGNTRTGKMRPGQRIGVVETTLVDGGRRLVLVRRDDTEHLLLLGSHGDLVIESNIPLAPDEPAAPSPPKPRATTAAPQPEPGGWPTLRMPSRDPGRGGGQDRP